MSLLIKNVQVLDGTGKSAVKADVLVKNDKISAIGDFPNYQANDIIDGLNSYLSPGFIDINTDSDHYLTIFSHPAQRDFLTQGVTTIIGGQCGASIAPLLHGSLDSIREWADTNKINVNWRTVGEFIEMMNRRNIGVNFGTFVGHNTIRSALIGETSRNLTSNELAVFIYILGDALKDGAFGLSSGLGYQSGKQISYQEIKLLVDVVAKYKGVYSTHIRDEKDNLISSINETIDIAKETGAKIIINHFRPLVGFENNYQQGLELIDKNADRTDIYFNLYPFDTSAVTIQTFLPQWAQEEGIEMMFKNIKTPGLREKILKQFPRLRGEEIIISAPMHDYLIGKTLKSFSQNRDLSIGQGLLALMELTRFRSVISYKNIKLKEVITALSHEKSIIASNSASFDWSENSIIPSNNPKLERAYYTFKKFLELVEKKKIMPIEKAIFKITGLPAVKLGIKNRGLIRIDYFADLVMFRGSEIKEVIINGKRVVRDGKFQDILAGKVLKRNQ